MNYMHNKFLCDFYVILVEKPLLIITIYIDLFFSACLNRVKKKIFKYCTNFHPKSNSLGVGIPNFPIYVPCPLQMPQTKVDLHVYVREEN